ncbi:hypothetical protein ACOSP7_017290 [Xanthoceras sorbifolium]|uniref:F-box domain-containing protein n=1 Tax=Xanthoceras sorbifolium TaxID=99658 RepID=A0ABQ8HHI7_9ROSI|nr:hypothetical protein JRO89_XS10G0034900 [Xanthoceras sorbifolium]
MNPGCRKKRKINICNDRREWCDLPEDLLVIISNHLNLADVLTFGRVCRNWRLFFSASKQKVLTSQPPLVFHIPSRASKSCYFYDMSSGIRYVTKLADFSDKSILGVSNGYLILERVFLYNSDIWAVNPVTGHQLKFPGMPQPNTTKYDRDNPYFKCRRVRAIFASFGCRQDFLVMILSKLHKNVRFCTSRDYKWKVYSFTGKTWDILDIALYKGMIFAITSELQIGLLKLGHPDLKLLNLECTPNICINVRFVASDDKLLVINFSSLRVNGVVQVYWINFEGWEWVKVNNLDDEALFLGDMMTSRLIKTSNWGGCRNCVYDLQFMSNTCYVYSLNGPMRRSVPTTIKGGVSPRKINCWYFLHQAYNINNVKEVILAET